MSTDGEDTANVAELISLRLLSAWLQCKSILHSSTNKKIIKEARDLEDLHYSHIQSLLRLFRGEDALFGKNERTGEPEPESGTDDTTVLDILKEIRALQEKEASEDEWEFTLTKHQAKLRAAIKARTHPEHGLAEKDQKYVLLEEAISGALKEGKRPEL